jgi:ABC-type antimicrobial peptide transport system permease subunit
VVENVKEDPFNFYIDRPAWYFPYAQLETGLPLNLLIHTAGDPQALVGSVRQAIREIAPRQPLSSVVTLESHVNTFLGPNRFGALLISLFAVAGLVLSAVGLYGLMSFIVARQVRQIGIRRALGAQRGDLMRLILGRGLRLTLLGLVLGLVLGLILNRFLSGLLYQVEGVGAGSFLVVAAVLLAVAVGALYLPARRATRIDPMHALREE